MHKELRMKRHDQKKLEEEGFDTSVQVPMKMYEDLQTALPRQELQSMFDVLPWHYPSIPESGSAQAAEGEDHDEPTHEQLLEILPNELIVSHPCPHCGHGTELRIRYKEESDLNLDRYGVLDGKDAADPLLSQERYLEGLTECIKELGYDVSIEHYCQECVGQVFDREFIEHYHLDEEPSISVLSFTHLDESTPHLRPMKPMDIYDVWRFLKGNEAVVDEEGYVYALNVDVIQELLDLKKPEYLKWVRTMMTTRAPKKTRRKK